MIPFLFPFSRGLLFPLVALDKIQYTFLTNILFCERVGASHSEYIKHKEGIPQGSMVRITCVAIAMNDMVEQLSP